MVNMNLGQEDGKADRAGNSSPECQAEKLRFAQRAVGQQISGSLFLFYAYGMAVSSPTLFSDA